MNFLYIVQNTGIFRCAAANQVACDFYIPFLYSFFIFLFYKDKRNSLQESGTHRQGMQKAPTLTAEIH